MIDTFAREISYARISLTDFCNLNCRYCMPPGGTPQHRAMLHDEELELLIQGLAQAGVRKIRFTGGEPTMRPGVFSLLERVCKTPGIEKWAMTTNALNLAQHADRLCRAGIGFLNVSLDTLDAAEYHTLTGGSLQQALAGIDAVLSAGFTQVKLNAVLIDGITQGQILHLAEFARTRPIDVRFIELMPLGPCRGWAQERFLPASAVLDALPGLMPDAPEPHAPARYYRLAGYQGRIGLITPLSCDFCADCNRIRITADGKLRPCLHADQEIDLRPVLQNPTALAARIRQAVQQKPDRHHLNAGQFPAWGMSQVGG